MAAKAKGQPIGRRLTVVLTEAELHALRSFLGLQFDGDDDDISAVVGDHHRSIQMAKRMFEKVSNAIANAPHEYR